MKIQSILGALGYRPKVREKQDGQSSQHQSSSHSGDSGHSGQESEKDQDSSKEASSAKVGKAVQDFQADALAQANGLSASMEGAGPGLRVVLKDGGGVVVRQLTGEEFLKLRQATSKDQKSRGKILDQKL